MSTPNVTPHEGGGEGGSGSTQCDQLARDLASLESSLAMFQARLNATAGPSGPGTPRESIATTIALLTNEISAIEATQRAQGCIGGVVPRPHDCSHIFDSPIYGSITINGVICRKWGSLNTQKTSSGGSVQDYLGFPIEATKSIFQNDREYIVQVFERGIIVDVQGTDNPLVVYGAIYIHYQELGPQGLILPGLNVTGRPGGIGSFLGAPLTDEVDAGKGGRSSDFENGEIYWRADTGAWEVHGAILSRWRALGGPNGVLGFPTSDETPVLQGNTEIGRVSRFEILSRNNTPASVGAIYWSSQTGAWEVYGPILNEWQQFQGGPPGKLGFPVSGPKPTPNGLGRFQNFQRGMIVWHLDSGAITITGGIALKLVSFAVGGNDNFNVQLNITASTGQVNRGRAPASGQYNSGTETFGPDTLLTIDAVRNDLTIDVWMEAISERILGEDDRKGTIITRYDIDNVWGLQAIKHDFSASAFTAVLKVEPLDLTLEPAPFRQQKFWPFHNFSTAELSWDQYQATFRDVDALDKRLRFNPFDHPAFHPFEIAFYAAVYHSLAQGGVCFGMCLEAIYALVHRSLSSEPIFSGNSYRKDGKPLDPTDVKDAETANEIFVKVGYQVGASMVAWFLGKLEAGALHDPIRGFKESRDAYNRGDWPILTISDKDKLSQSGHAVVPYHWDDSDPKKWRILVANPNYPPPYDDEDIHNQIVIDLLGQSFSFQFDDGAPWTGSNSEGGRLLSIPFSQLNSRPVTPLFFPIALILSGSLIVVSGNGETRQITDERGRALYRYDQNGAKQMNEDVATRIPHFMLVPSHQVSTGPVPELYYWRRDSGDVSRQIRQQVHGPSKGSYQWSLHSGPLSAIISSDGLGYVADQITVDSLGTAQQNVAYSVGGRGAPKKVSISIAGWFGTEPQQVKWFDLKNLRVAPGQAIHTRVLNAGQELAIQNTGQASSFDLQIHSGRTEPAVRKNVQVGAGKALRIQPGDWTPASLGRTTVHIEEMSHLDGSVLRRFDL